MAQYYNAMNSYVTTATKVEPPSRRFRILILGPTGSGKSSLIRAASSADVKVSDDGESCTQDCQNFKSKYHRVGDVAFQLVDTPGFDDSVRDDFDILRIIAAEAKDIAGVIFMHSALEDRLTGEARINLRVAKAMCGEGFYNHVVICTTKWNNILPNERPAARARMMKHFRDKSIFGDVMAKGATHMEFWMDQREPCLGILQHFASLYDNPQMAIEKQLATKADISGTSAFRDLDEIRASRGAQGPQRDGMAAHDALFDGDARQRYGRYRDLSKSTMYKSREEGQQRRYASASEGQG